ncbi:hypothetical protein KBI23_09540 [bacterium]|nr:hypothetical protein [bacterium]MBP9810409.1 hypothetical protein [bacterium]
MATEDELLQDILEKDPEILLLGEIHSETTEFRARVLELLPKLQTWGFRTLAIELPEDMRADVEKYCLASDGFGELLTAIGGAAGFDEKLSLAIRSWVTCGGSLCFANCADPTTVTRTNDAGRDQYMCDKLSEFEGKVVALLGDAHCQVRSNKTTYFENFDSESDEKDQCFEFRSAAEKLKEKGLRIYTFLEFSFLNDYSRKKDYVSKLMLKSEMDPHLSTIKNTCHAGEGHVLAPELHKQHFFWNPSEVDAIYINDYEPAPPDMKGFSRKLKELKGKRIAAMEGEEEY